MTAGYPPFAAENSMKLYDKIVAGKFRYPSHFSKDLRDLVANLIVVDKTARFGGLRGGIADIKQHTWFHGFDWDGVLAKKVKPIYKPTTTGPDDTTNFIDITEAEKIRKCSVNEYSFAFADFNTP